MSQCVVVKCRSRLNFFLTETQNPQIKRTDLPLVTNINFVQSALNSGHSHFRFLPLFYFRLSTLLLMTLTVNFYLKTLI